MTTLYAQQQAWSYATLKRKGVAVTFTLTDPGTYDPATDLWTWGSTTTVAGYAVRIAGNPITYARLSLVLSEAPTLLFGPTTAGSLPALGSTVTWRSIVYAVRDVNPIEPDGTAIR